MGQSVRRVFGRDGEFNERGENVGRGFGIFGRSGRTAQTDFGWIFQDCEIGRPMATESAAVPSDVPRETSSAISPDRGKPVTGTGGQRISSFNPSRAEIKKNYEALKLTAARSIWKQQHKLTPSGKWTWAKWFEAKFKISLQDFKKEQVRKIRETG
jgi:hypothetical protein